MGKDILYRVGNGGRCGCESVSREVLLQVEIPEKWTQEPPCFAITTGVRLRSHTKNQLTHCSLRDVAVILKLVPENSSLGTTRHRDKNCFLVIVAKPREWEVNIGSGNGLVPPGNSPLPEPMLAQLYVAIWRH